MWKSIVGGAALLGLTISGANATVVSESSLFSSGNVLPEGTTGVNGFLNGAGFLQDSFDNFEFTLPTETFLTVTLKGLSDDLSLFLWEDRPPGFQPLGLAGNDDFNIGSVCADITGLTTGDSCLSMTLAAGSYGVTVIYDDTTLPGFNGSPGISDTDGILDTPVEIVPGVSRFGSSTNYQLRFSSPVSGSVSVVPLPAALPLLATVLASFGFLGWRRKRVA